MKKTFNIKDKSAQDFFLKFASIDEFDKRNNRESMSAYYFMRDEIILRKESEIEIDTDVIIELEDYSNLSRKHLINTYTYQVMEYDDLCVKLKLVDFTISLLKD